MMLNVINIFVFIFMKEFFNLLYLLDDIVGVKWKVEKVGNVILSLE